MQESRDVEVSFIARNNESDFTSSAYGLPKGQLCIIFVGEDKSDCEVVLEINLQKKVSLHIQFFLKMQAMLIN